MMLFDNVFRSYDIRGIYKSEIDEDFALKLGQSFGTFNKGDIVVGNDVRIGSESLKENLINGLLSTGCNVIDIGLATTPLIIFSTWYYKTNGGIIVTASHNPKEYNGFKFYGKNAVPISFESGLNSVLDIFKSGGFSEGNGRSQNKNILGDYERYLFGHVQINKPIKMKVVLDSGNGPTGSIYPKIFRDLGIEVVELFSEPDGNFPNRGPDPLKETNLTALKQKVVETRADIGFAYDIDADRVAVVDENGSVVPARNVFAILIEHILGNNSNKKIVYDVLSSSLIEKVILANGGFPIVCKVGHTYMMQKFIDEDAVFGGEQSGHYYFKEMFGGDDTLFASLKLIEYLTLNNKLLSESSNKFPKYFIEELRLVVPDSKKTELVEKLKSDAIIKRLNVNTLDGLKIFFDDGWAAFRPSNTAPQVVIVYEGVDEKSFQRIRDFANEMIGKYNDELK